MSIQDVLSANYKRLQESQSKQTSNSGYMDEMYSGLTQDPGEWSDFAKSQGIDPYSTIPSAYIGTARTGSADEQNNKILNAKQAYEAQKTKYAAESGKRAATEFWKEQSNAYEKANEDTLRDRQTMLEEVAKFKTNSILNNDQVNKILSDEKEKILAQNNEVLDRIQKQYASQGRSADPLVLATAKKRLNAQMNDQLAIRQTSLEMDRAQMNSTYLSHLESTLAGTQRKIMDPQVALQFMNQLGASASPVQNAGYSGGGGNLGGGLNASQSASTGTKSTSTGTNSTSSSYSRYDLGGGTNAISQAANKKLITFD